jgi:hypothetical protein
MRKLICSECYNLRTQTFYSIDNLREWAYGRKDVHVNVRWLAKIQREGSITLYWCRLKPDVITISQYRIRPMDNDDCLAADIDECVNS